MIAAANVTQEDAPTRAEGVGPTRTCVGCRERAPAASLMRVVASPETPPRIVADIRHRLPGRGASVHPSRRCLEQAVKRRAFPRALRVDGAMVSLDDLAAEASRAYAARAHAVLASAVRAGAAVYGTDATRQEVRAGRVLLLVVAEDAEGRREELARVASELGGRVVVLGTKESLGRALGRSEVGVAGVLTVPFAETIREAAARAGALSEAV